MNTPSFEQYESLASNMNQLLYERAAAASPIEVLSTHNDKLLQIVESSDGERFVTRNFTSLAIDDIRFCYGIGFRTAWEGMHRAFSDVALDIVPSGLVEADGEYPFIIVSEYLEDGQPFATAPTDTKKAVANSLGRLLTTSGDYIPAPEMIREDMFLVVQRNSEPIALLTDVDPLVTPSYRMQNDDTNSAFFISKLADLAWDRWCEESERVEVISALVVALGDYALDQFGFDSATARAFMDMHLMSNGVDNRKTLTYDD